MREICSMLTVKTSRRRSSIFIVNFEHISLSSSVFMGLQRRVKKIDSIVEILNENLFIVLAGL